MTINRNGLLSADLEAPVVLPTLNLDFANSQSLDERITFTRGSIGTRVNQNGLIETIPANQPRFDFDPISGECKGLLIEESRTNLLTWSEDFGDASWFKGDGSVSTNLITAPDGTTTADAFIENTLSNKFHYINRTLSKSASSIVYTASCWLKDKGRQVIFNMQSGASNGVVCRFNPATGQMIVSPVAFGTGWTAGSFSVVPYPNGWYRVSMTATSDTLTTVVFQLATYNTSVASNNYTGDGTSGVYIWGAQLEAGAFPTSYIPTGASTVTRSADNASMTGTNFSSWYNQSEGTIYTNNRIPYTPSSANLYFTIANLIIFSRISIEQTSSNGLTYFNQNGTTSQSWTLSGSGILPVNTSRKTTYSYSSSNNTTLLSGTSNQNYNFNQKSRVDVNKSMTGLYLGAFINSLYLNGTISRFTYYPKALSPAQLQYLTQ